MSGLTDSGKVDVVVIGSGFGGSVAANRLALAGKRVLVLERGPWRDSLPVEFGCLDDAIEARRRHQHGVAAFRWVDVHHLPAREPEQRNGDGVADQRNGGNGDDPSRDPPPSAPRYLGMSHANEGSVNRIHLVPAGCTSCLSLTGQTRTVEAS